MATKGFSTCYETPTILNQLSTRRSPLIVTTGTGGCHEFCLWVAVMDPGEVPDDGLLRNRRQNTTFVMVPLRRIADHADRATDAIEALSARDGPAARISIDNRPRFLPRRSPRSSSALPLVQRALPASGACHPSSSGVVR